MNDQETITPTTQSQPGTPADPEKPSKKGITSIGATIGGAISRLVHRGHNSSAPQTSAPAEQTAAAITSATEAATPPVAEQPPAAAPTPGQEESNGPTSQV